MKPWAERSQIEATLLNPALIALLIREAATGYESGGTEMSWPLLFLIPPLVLHRPTRNALPRDTRTHLSTWVAREPVLRAGFPDRAAAMSPLVREGLRFGLRHGVLLMTGGTVRGADVGAAPLGELRTLLRSASLVGRWFAKSSQPSTIFALFGVRP